MTGDPRFGAEQPPGITKALPAALGVGSWAFTITFYKHKQKPRWKDKVCSSKGRSSGLGVRRPGPHLGVAWNFPGLCLPICKIRRLDLGWEVVINSDAHGAGSHRQAATVAAHGKF